MGLTAPLPPELLLWHPGISEWLLGAAWVEFYVKKDPKATSWLGGRALIDVPCLPRVQERGGAACLACVFAIDFLSCVSSL